MNNQMFEGTMVNIDPNMCRYFLESLKDNWTDIDSKAKQHVECYRDNGISDLLFCIFEQSSITRSQVFTTRSDKFYQKTENGNEVDYTQHPYIALLHKADKQGVDLIDIWFKHTWEMGIRPWMSIRMNDIHFCTEETSFLRSDFHYEAKRNGWTLGERYGLLGYCLNYEVPQVYEKMLSYIKEQLLHYDVYGIELDFRREIACVDFRDRPDCCETMNRFMADVRSITRQAEVVWGHPVKIMTRLTRSMAHNRMYGYDTLFWARNGLVDMIAPTPHFVTVDTDMPIQEWVDTMKPYGVDVCAGLDCNVLKAGLFNGIETVRAQVVQYYYQGSSQMYLYNFFGYDRFNESLHKELPSIWKTCADVELAKQGIRRYVMTYQDDQFGLFPNIWRPLPCVVEDEATFEIYTGFVGENEKLTLYLDVDNVNDLIVHSNGIPAVCVGKGEDAFITKDVTYNTEHLISYNVHQSEGSDVVQILKLTTKNPMTVRYIELKVDKND